MRLELIRRSYNLSAFLWILGTLKFGSRPTKTTCSPSRVKVPAQPAVSGTWDTTGCRMKPWLRRAESDAPHTDNTMTDVAAALHRAAHDP